MKKVKLHLVRSGVGKRSNTALFGMQCDDCGSAQCLSEESKIEKLGEDHLGLSSIVYSRTGEFIRLSLPGDITLTKKEGIETFLDSISQLSCPRQPA
jgi:hypothetical protein